MVMFRVRVRVRVRVKVKVKAGVEVRVRVRIGARVLMQLGRKIEVVCYVYCLVSVLPCVCLVL
jgi:hypothetical protein